MAPGAVEITGGAASFSCEWQDMIFPFPWENEAALLISDLPEGKRVGNGAFHKGHLGTERGSLV